MFYINRTAILPKEESEIYELKEYKQALTALETAFNLTEENEESEFDMVLSEEELNQLYQELQKLAK